MFVVSSFTISSFIRHLGQLPASASFQKLNLNRFCSTVAAILAAKEHDAETGLAADRFQSGMAKLTLGLVT